MTSVKFSSTQQQLNQRCFEDCTELTEIEIPRVWLIGRKAFEGCSSLKSVSLGLDGGNFTITGQAFANCTNLFTLFLGKGLLTSAFNAFEGCSNLKQIFFEGNTKDWESVCRSSSWTFDKSVQIKCRG